jgi:hypothetical protein
VNIIQLRADNMESFEFINQLVKHIKSRNIFDLVLRDVEQNKKTWDQMARERIGHAIKDVFQNFYPEIDVREAVNVEGEGKTFKPKPYPLFGSYGQHPDIRIIKPTRIAIELDHSGRKEVKLGTKLKMALAKASFNFLSGDWDYCVLLFHNYSGKPINLGEKEKRILGFYEEKLHTKIYLFE